MSEKIIIAGGPNAGKTTLLHALGDRFPEAQIVPEPATNVITREQQEAAANPKYEPRLPWLDYKKFGPEVLAESLRLEKEIARTAILDRSIIDTIAYCRLNQFEEFIPEVRTKIADADYSLVLFCAQLSEYQATNERREDEEKARLTHIAIRKAYEESGLELIHIPPFSVEKRRQIASDLLIKRNILQ